MSALQAAKASHSAAQNNKGLQLRLGAFLHSCRIAAGRDLQPGFFIPHHSDSEASPIPFMIFLFSRRAPPFPLPFSRSRIGRKRDSAPIEIVLSRNAPRLFRTTYAGDSSWPISTTFRSRGTSKERSKDRQFPIRANRAHPSPVSIAFRSRPCPPGTPHPDCPPASGCTSRTPYLSKPAHSASSSSRLFAPAKCCPR